MSEITKNDDAEETTGGYTEPREIIGSGLLLGIPEHPVSRQFSGDTLKGYAR